MSRDSYLSIERGVCVVCGQRFEAGTLMIEKHLLVDSCVVGWELCRADAQMHRLGFVALVECELDVNAAISGATISASEVNRTGNVMHVTRETFVSLFKADARPGLPCAYVPRGTVQSLRAIMQKALN